jgi:hypothetical protein
MGKLPDASQHRELAEITERSLRRRRDHLVESLK